MQSANNTPWYQSVADNLTKIGTAYLTLAQQKQLNEINIQRAQQGLAPLDASQYQTGVQVGVSQSTRNTGIIIVSVIAATWLLSTLLRR